MILINQNQKYIYTLDKSTYLIYIGNNVLDKTIIIATGIEDSMFT